MPVSFDGKLVIAISSRALFNLADSHKVYLEEGLEAFQDYQTRHEDDVLEPGDAFTLVQKLLADHHLEMLAAVEQMQLALVQSFQSHQRPSQALVQYR